MKSPQVKHEADARRETSHKWGFGNKKRDRATALMLNDNAHYGAVRNSKKVREILGAPVPGTESDIKSPNKLP